MWWRGRGRGALLVLAVVLAGCATTPDRPARPVGDRPNIVYLLADDLDVGSVWAMPNLRRLLIDQGTSFNNFFASYPLCCPSRATVLRGQYAHNHGVLGNVPPRGGFRVFHERGHENSTVATWLQAAGYRTALMGKYLNLYPDGVEDSYVPPGWDEWQASTERGFNGFDYVLHANGMVTSYGQQPQDYLTDVLSRRANDFVRASAREPFFLYLAPQAPHWPATPAPRHVSMFADATAPRPGSFNEPDVSDKPSWIRDLPPLTIEQQATVDAVYRKRLASLQAIDEMIASLIDTLTGTGQLANTYFVFNSDNGFTFGTHRAGVGKNTAYDEDIRVPLIVRGPSVPAGRTREQLTGNIDLAPTFAELAGVPAPDFIDGRSLVPLLREDPPSTATWRQAYLIEHESIPADRPKPPPWMREQQEPTFNRPNVPTLRGLRTSQYLYVEYTTGDRELYDLAADPAELTNLAPTADPRLLDTLTNQLHAMRECQAKTCRAAEISR
ncbi:MAG: sulfatase family protein [Pseudonocardiaceae bacterium]